MLEYSYRKYDIYCLIKFRNMLAYKDIFIYLSEISLNINIYNDNDSI